ncbi:NAD(P)/FAD-dependent oxidoreductase [Mycolicibacterium baixiangningiae]|uniref:NAD(P)/FAD-dependent oxidoreductase n=1 Tax=Mycolicibacterium baixiangningiae TaxID=2761578 RepID=UPI001866EA1F|nr:FAD-dependent oxidoreductase [Mycolicibacterium baixiangningiae]
MKCIVIGAGAWGLPTAAELASRGHEVRLVDRHGIGNPLSSSCGPTRMWRLGDPDPVRVRLAVRAVAAMKRLEEATATTVHERRGLLWRDTATNNATASTCVELGIAHEGVRAADVANYLPGLRADGRDAVWLPDAGIVFAERALQAQYARFCRAGGRYGHARGVVEIDERPNGLSVTYSDRTREDADAIVVAAGPESAFLLQHLGIEVPLYPYLEQVVHFGDADGGARTDGFPCLFDGEVEDGEGRIYAMPTPGLGYKVGLDQPIGDYHAGEPDRTPRPERTEGIRRRVSRDFASIPATVVDAQVCSWTDTADGQFIMDALPSGLVFGCGCIGEGFKYSALMGEILADLAEGRPQDDDVRSFRLARFRGRSFPARRTPTHLGSTGVPATPAE